MPTFRSFNWIRLIMVLGGPMKTQGMMIFMANWLCSNVGEVLTVKVLMFLSTIQKSYTKIFHQLILLQPFSFVFRVSIHSTFSMRLIVWDISSVINSKAPWTNKNICYLVRSMIRLLRLKLNQKSRTSFAWNIGQDEFLSV